MVCQTRPWMASELPDLSLQILGPGKGLYNSCLNSNWDPFPGAVLVALIPVTTQMTHEYGSPKFPDPCTPISGSW